MRQLVSQKSKNWLMIQGRIDNVKNRISVFRTRSHNMVGMGQVIL